MLFKWLLTVCGMKRAEIRGYVRISRYKLLCEMKGLQPTIIGMFYDRVLALVLCKNLFLKTIYGFVFY